MRIRNYRLGKHKNIYQALQEVNYIFEIVFSNHLLCFTYVMKHIISFHELRRRYTRIRLSSSYKRI